MAAQKGKDLLLKIDDTGGGTYATVAGLRSRSIAFNANSVDITHTESAGMWRELLAGAGMRTARVAGSGIFKDAASDATIRIVFFQRADPQLAGGDPRLRHYHRSVPDFIARVCRRP